MVLQEGLFDVKVTEGDRQNGPQYRRNSPSKTFGKIVDNVDRIVGIGICSLCRNPVFSNELRCKDQTGSYMHKGCYQGAVSAANPAGGQVQNITRGNPTTGDTRQEMVHTLMSKAGIDNVQAAQQYLQENNWDLELCLQACKISVEAAAAKKAAADAAVANAAQEAAAAAVKAAKNAEAAAAAKKMAQLLEASRRESDARMEQLLEAARRESDARMVQLLAEASRGGGPGCCAVTMKDFKGGAKVVRGPDWKWSDQDGGAGNTGILAQSLDSDGWVSVRWTGEGSNKYRVANAKDLLYHSSNCVCRQGSEGLTRKTIIVGDRVRVKKCVTSPRYGWGEVCHESIGVMKRTDGGEGEVDFPEQSGWNCLLTELERC